MTKFLIASFAFVSLLASQAQAAVINFSTSASDANAGTSLSLEPGNSGSMYVWVSSDPGQTIVGMDLGILSDNASVLQATSWNIANPANRWASAVDGTLGDLVTGSSAIALPPFAGTGLSTSGAFELYGTVEFLATDLGTTNLTFVTGSNGFGDLGGSFTPTFGTGSVSVSAVPEPSSMVALAAVGTAVGAYRRRKAKKNA